MKKDIPSTRTDGYELSVPIPTSYVDFQENTPMQEQILEVWEAHRRRGEQPIIKIGLITIPSPVLKSQDFSQYGAQFWERVPYDYLEYLEIRIDIWFPGFSIKYENMIEDEIQARHVRGIYFLVKPEEAKVVSERSQKAIELLKQFKHDGLSDYFVPIHGNVAISKGYMIYLPVQQIFHIRTQYQTPHV